MNINENHLLEGTGVSYKESPNRGDAISTGLPDTIVIHYTAGSSVESSISWLSDPKSMASAHLVIGRDGSITQLVPFDTIAWHAGKSAYRGRVGFNKYAIGIEIDNAGRLKKNGSSYTAWFGKAYPEEEVVEAVHGNESKPSYWHRYTEKQITIIRDICILLVDTYPITSILGHQEIAPGRKEDPGPAFPLDELREQVLHWDGEDEGPPEPRFVRNPGIVTASKLNIRTSPIRSSPTVAPPLLRGTIVDIVQETNGWYEVQVQTRGWVKKEYIKT